MHVEFVHDISLYFKCWCVASDIKNTRRFKRVNGAWTIQKLSFRSCSNLCKQTKPVTAYEAAVMDDEFFLIHKTSFGSKTYGENLQKKTLA